MNADDLALLEQHDTRMLERVAELLRRTNREWVRTARSSFWWGAAAGVVVGAGLTYALWGAP